MAGRGSRLRPHSLTVPKPLIPVAGQPIVHRLVKDIVGLLNEPIDEIAFILGNPAFFGEAVVNSLKELAKELGVNIENKYGNLHITRQLGILIMRAIEARQLNQNIE